MCRLPAAAFRIASTSSSRWTDFTRYAMAPACSARVNLLVASVGGDHDDPRVGTLQADHGCRLRPAQARQPRVHQRDVRPLLPEQIDRLLRRGGLGAHFQVGLEREDAREPHADEIVIVHEHDAQRPAHALRRRPVRTRRDAHAGAASGCAVELKRAAELVDPFANASQAEVRVQRRGLPAPRPQPSSWTVRTTWPGVNWTSMSILPGLACFSALVTASSPMRSR